MQENTSAITSTQHIRQLNRSSIMNALRSRPGLTQTGLIHHTQLSRVTVSAILDELQQLGWVVGESEERRSRGAPSTHYRLNEAEMTFIGVDVSPEGSVLSLVDVYQNLVTKSSFTLEEFLTGTGDLASALNRSHRRVLGGTVSVPGIVSSDSTTVIESTVLPSLHYNELLLKLQSSLDVPMRYINNAMACALTEALKTSVESLVYLSVGSSIGAGIIVGNQPLSLGNSVGEIAHMIVNPQGPYCDICGRNGCLDSYVNVNSLARQFSLDAVDPRNLTAKANLLNAIHALLEDEATDHYTLLHDSFDAIAQACESITFLLGRIPIVLGGKLGALLRPGTELALRRRNPWIQPEIRRQHFDVEEQWRPSVGAAMFAVNSWFVSPNSNQR
ncbi:ROK family transcriptional regulator [Alicyclobacillus sp. SO9]|uniref:ROK family transcriptional regulator n=1 Tax=Alicyclobacillus sp. SO9 TaxID=2665646 RepID=UPI0018E90070|nr:ROK family transcriptional regulator [Alicyclobacillus sp. SO9]QQE80536.1 ROK family transcriptional regulator [Alicyclobacillus sp. SO9]